MKTYQKIKAQFLLSSLKNSGTNTATINFKFG